MSTSELLNYITLKEACPVAMNSNEGDSSSSSSTASDFNFRFPNLEYNEPQESLQKSYFNKVETANDLIPEIEELEKKYFTDKYGKDIYDYLIIRRKNYIINKTLPQSCDTTTTLSNVGLVRNIKEDISNELYMYNKLHENEANTKINNFKFSIKTLEQTIKDMNNKSELASRKLIYRNDVIYSYMNLNSMITFIYYFILAFVFTVLFINNKMNLGKNWMIYVTVIIFPYLYTYLFKFIVFLSVKISEKLNYNGPKNAFVRQTNSYDSIIDKYNI